MHNSSVHTGSFKAMPLPASRAAIGQSTVASSRFAATVRCGGSRRASHMKPNDELTLRRARWPTPFSHQGRVAAGGCQAAARFQSDSHPSPRKHGPTVASENLMSLYLAFHSMIFT